MTLINHKKFQQRILKWFDRFGRHDLPWQANTTPYRVWVSEIMLQQTQVTTVIPYYQRFLQRFPNIKQLACAELDEVLSYWSGLGYYARGRNLHKTARVIHNDYHGRFPTTVTALSELPGIGRSTAGAILSLSCDIHAAILDGNVKRVLTRFFAISGWPEATAVKTQLWQLAETLTPKIKCGNYNQAMMDLGATICSRTQPRCDLCPLNTDCQAYQTQQIANFPSKKLNSPKPKKQVWLLIFENSQGELLLEKRDSTGIWGGLWSFPECSHKEDFVTACNSRHLGDPTAIEPLSPLKHVFSHFELLIKPVRILVNPKFHYSMDSNKQVWYNRKDEFPGGIPAPISKILVKQLNIKRSDNAAHRILQTVK